MISKKECVEMRKTIQDSFEKDDVKISAKEIDDKIKQLIAFKVPLNEIKATVIRSLNKKHDTKIAAGGNSGSTQDATVAALKPKQWANLRVKVLQIWEATHESIGQVGLVADHTGAIKFTAWASAGVDSMEEGKSYRLKNIVVNEYNEKNQVNLNKTSSIEEIDDVEASSPDTTITGCLVDIQNGSGYIKRCPECNRALFKGACTDHGKIEGVGDVRIKAVIDDGTTATNCLLDREVTEKLTGITLEECIAMASDALDAEVVVNEYKTTLIGRYFTVSGPAFDSLLVKTIEPVTKRNVEEATKIIEEAKEMM